MYHICIHAIAIFLLFVIPFVFETGRTNKKRKLGGR